MTVSRKKSAFTLIELLVVIAIIAILAAILFPVFAQAREKARQSACISNMKQIGLAFMQYVQDYDETFPGTVGTGLASPDCPSGSSGVNDGGAYDVIWPFIVAPYISGVPGNWAGNATNIYVCPSNDLIQGLPISSPQDDPCAIPILQKAGVTLKTDVTPNAYAWHASYALNDAVVGEADIRENTAGKSVVGTSYGSWQQPASEFLLMEAGLKGAVNDSDVDSNDMDKDDNEIFMKHNGGMNLAYIDGHVKWVKDSRVLGPDPGSSSTIFDNKGTPVYFRRAGNAPTPWRPVYP